VRCSKPPFITGGLARNTCARVTVDTSTIPTLR
jgi:hypothetical protein